LHPTYTRNMRFCILILLCFSAVSYGAVNVQDGKVSANLNGESLDSVIESIRQQTQIRFSVQEGMGQQSISANFENLPVAVAVKKMLEGTGINFVVLGDNEGQPESIFIGTSEKPGTAPRRIDNRPTQNRGVVTPVAPMPPAEPMPLPPQNDESRQQPRKQPPTTSNVPTGGGFVPQSDKDKDQDNPEQQQPIPETAPEEQQSEEQ
jgi:hypothetical protein